MDRRGSVLVGERRAGGSKGAERLADRRVARGGSEEEAEGEGGTGDVGGAAGSD
ncbi:MAG: hypothetical protein AAGF11_39905 [Myxococcota bacterium]